MKFHLFCLQKQASNTKKSIDVTNSSIETALPGTTKETW